MWERKVAENAERFQQLTDRVSQLTITETSSDGSVKVTVSADGLLTGLVLKERWHPLPAAEVAAQIMDCIQRAQARIPDLLRQLAVDTVGPNEPSVHLLLDDARRRFPLPPPRPGDRREDLEIGRSHESPPAAPPAPRPPSEPGDEDDWDEREVLKDV